MSKGDNVRPHNKKRYDENFEAAFGKRELKTWFIWRDCLRANGRMEWLCPHHIGHGNHIHGCDGCCERDDYPGRETK